MQPTARTNSYDMLIIGGGVQGLWIARCAQQAGLTCALVERAACGAAASSTPLAALMPHLPGRLDAKKQFQLDALLALPDEIAELEDETGLVTGFRRCGRIVPVWKETFRAKAEDCLSLASEHWPSTARGTANWRLEQVDEQAGGAALPEDWLAPEAETLGRFCEDLTAVIDARAYTATLRAAVAPSVDLMEATEFARWDGETRTAYDAVGREIARATTCVIASGAHTFALLADHGHDGMGDGIKGHAATFELQTALSANALPPVLYDNGIYIVARSATEIAVGTTTEYDWQSADPIEADAERMLDRVRTLCPRLKRAKLTQLWSGIRPRASTRNPMVGELDADRGLYVASGGYKITFGIAHRLARGLIEQVTCRTAPSVDLPTAFAPPLATFLDAAE